MKKYLLFGLLVAIIPGVCSAADHRFTQLVREKQRKMAELEKCTGSTKGLQIAGISTLGLSAAGVAVNIAEAKKIKEYDKKIENIPKQLEKKKQELENKKQETAKLEGADTDGESYVAHELDGTCDTNKEWGVEASVCSGLNRGEWRVRTIISPISGIAVCANNEGTIAEVGNPNGNNGKYCWCKMTTPSVSSWVYNTDYDNYDGCANSCADSCAYDTMEDSGFRSSLLKK